MRPNYYFLGGGCGCGTKGCNALVSEREQDARAWDAMGQTRGRSSSAEGGTRGTYHSGLHVGLVRVHEHGHARVVFGTETVAVVSRALARGALHAPRREAHGIRVAERGVCLACGVWGTGATRIGESVSKCELTTMSWGWVWLSTANGLPSSGRSPGLAALPRVASLNSSPLDWPPTFPECGSQTPLRPACHPSPNVCHSKAFPINF